MNSTIVKGNLFKRAIDNLKVERTAPSDYRPTFRESGYRRSIVNRLTPLTTFLLGLGILALFAAAILVISHLLGAGNGTENLSDAMPFQPEVTIYQQPAPTAVSQAQKKIVVQAESVAVQQAKPTVDPSRAPWAAQLSKQLDGTLMAPRAVVDKAMTDLGAYYAIQHDMSLQDYMAKRDDILKTYFTGAALAQMQSVEANRDLYGVNRAGRYSIEVRDFSEDGYSAKAAVITRGWIVDLYDVTTSQLLASGRIKNDSLTIMSVLYDQADGHWKFASVDETTDLKP
ncbi:MAG: hypothetical protein M1434_12160 [Chloroflexi bacterium]|nr:hypothetical protein [Chloroflexota bacterium]MCL5275476.1 hypothetical protein [Chloroflexota bacterium]